MKKLVYIAFAITFGLSACSSEGGSHSAVVRPDPNEGEDSSAVVIPAKPIDYSVARAMNTKLGKGINLGNAWESDCYNTKNPTPYNYGNADGVDGCWSNPIKDDYFALVKSAGFNSVRIPVRWQQNSNPTTHEVNPDRLNGVKEDVKLAIDAGLAVVISFNWYHEIMEAATNASKNPTAFQNELVHFTSIWTQVAKEFDSFPDDMLVWDILNEPLMKDPTILNEVMLAGYTAIRAAAPNKTIMFESNQAAKFYQISILNLPEDGNIIYSGHYYEPFTYSHQGHSYNCAGDGAYKNVALADLTTYAGQIAKRYPDINGGSIPVNMGEFGVSGGGVGPCGANDPSAKLKAQWAKLTIQAAEANGFSWHYWGFVNVGGFEAYDKRNKEWYEGFPEAFGL